MRTLLRLLRPMWTRANDWFLNIQTTPVRKIRPRYDDRPWWRGERTAASVHDDNKAFASPDYHYIRKIRSLVHLRPSDVLYDLGSGTGRILCVFARKKIRGCIGIELFQPLCEIARDNATRLRGRKAPITVQCGDAATADMVDGTIYLMFNPFGAETMRDVLSNIKNSLARNPRDITIVYYNAVHESVLMAEPWLREYHRFETSGGLWVSFWNAHLPEPAKGPDLARLARSASCGDGTGPLLRWVAGLPHADIERWRPTIEATRSESRIARA